MDNHCGIFHKAIKKVVRKYQRNEMKLYSELMQAKKLDIDSSSYVDEESSVGAYTYVGKYCAVTKSRIGRYCSIANNVLIGQGEHVMTNVSTSTWIYQDSVDVYKMLTKDECVIGNDVWIGCQAVIRRGVNIGDGAVIGANSFVNKDVPPYAIVAGSPATIKGYRFDKKIIDKLLESEWWNLELSEARAFIASFEKEQGINGNSFMR